MRIGYDVAGRGWMYTRRVARPRALRPRHSVENQWDLLARARHRAAGSRRAFPVEMPVDDARARRRSRERLRARRRRRRRAADRHSRQRRQSVPPLAGRRVSSELAAALAARDARRRARRDVGTVGARRRRPGRSPTRGRGSATATANASLVVRRVFAGRAARAGRSRSALHRRRQRAAAHRGDERACRSSALYGPTLPVRSAPWRDAAVRSRSPWRWRVCRAGRAISASARLAISAA